MAATAGRDKFGGEQIKSLIWNRSVDSKPLLHRPTVCLIKEVLGLVFPAFLPSRLNSLQKWDEEYNNQMRSPQDFLSQLLCVSKS